MFNPFKPLELIKAEVFTSMPGKFRKKGRTALVGPQPPGRRSRMLPRRPVVRPRGQLWIVDIPFGRIFRITPKGEWELVIAVRRLAQRHEVPQGRPRSSSPTTRKGCSRSTRRPASSRPMLEHRLQRRLQGAQRPALRVERRPLLHRPGPDRHRRSDRARVPAARRTARCDRLCDQRAEPERHHAVHDREALSTSASRARSRCGACRSWPTARSPRPASRSSSPAASAGPTASRWTPRTACSSASSASASGASTPTCCRRISSTPTDHKHHHLANIAFGGPDRKTALHHRSRCPATF